MKKFILFSSSILLISILNCPAQDYERELHGEENMKKIIELLKTDNILQLADLVQYPLTRPDPIPDITSKESFILYYSTLFDSNFKKILIDTSRSFSDMIVNYASYDVGFHGGDIYLSENGLITDVNYSSEKEIELKQTINKETLSLLYPEIKRWKDNVLVLRSEKFLIRVDLMDDNSLRYISWSSPKKISDKPDLILFNGNQEFQGTMGGVTYSFANGDWTYVVDDVALCDDINNCGYFLRLIQNNEEKKKIKMIRIK